MPLERVGGLRVGLGLTGDEARLRRARFGSNQIVESVAGGWRVLVRETAKDPMLWFLLATSALFAVVGEFVESLVLLLALIPILGMDAFLHRRTYASTAGLSSRLAAQATVLRDGERREVPSEDLVPGDLAYVAAGEPFPADGLIEAGENLQADESALTGEAYPVRKRRLEGLPQDALESRVDGEVWGFAGTRLLTGQARLRIVYAGAETLYGEIVRSAASDTHARTPLQNAVAGLVAVLSVGAALLCLVLAIVRWQQGHGIVDALVSAVTLAVAALPEEFPVVLTFFLGVGVYRLAQRQALVRRAVVVENIGRVSCICSDKTGTLTEGRLRLTHEIPAPDETDRSLLEIAAAASRHESGDPIDVGVLAAAGTAPMQRVATFPFTEDRKRETGILRKGAMLLVAVKGAPEAVLAMCDQVAESAAIWRERVEELAGSGHKVIACAYQHLEAREWHGGEPDRDFRFAGLLAFEDPVRSGVAEAVEQCRAAGIHVVMVTGDHPAAARAVAREIGLGAEAPRIVQADELAARFARGDTSGLHDVDGIARAVPSQKVELVRALQEAGEIVAVTGDGVNDVPALQAADVGIAMGERGTRSAREVAAIVLLDDNFRSIVRAVAEGRQLFRNLKLSFAYLLMVHIPLVLTAALIPLAGYPLLYLPVHIVWLELIIHPTALLVFQDLAGDQRLGRIRRTTRLRFFDGREWLSIAGTGLSATMLVSASYLHSLGAGYDVEHARATALVALMIASAGVTAALSRLRSTASRITVAATLSAALFFVQTPTVARLLHLTPLHADDWGLAFAAGTVVALLAALFDRGSARFGER